MTFYRIVKPERLKEEGNSPKPAEDDIFICTDMKLVNLLDFIKKQYKIFNFHVFETTEPVAKIFGYDVID